MTDATVPYATTLTPRLLALARLREAHELLCAALQDIDVLPAGTVAPLLAAVQALTEARAVATEEASL